MITLKENDYDVLEFAAEVFGGVGGGSSFIIGKNDHIEPWCIHGLAHFIDPTGALSARLDEANLVISTNDHDIVKQNATRISWKTYVTRGHIVRGK